MSGLTAAAGAPAGAHLEAVVRAAQARRPDELRSALHDATRACGLERCVDDVLMPAVRHVGCWPEIAGEQESAVGLAVETMRAWLDALTVAAPPPLERPPLLMACAPGDRHSLGLEALTVLLRYQRQPCRLLAPRLSAGAIATAVRANRPGAVVVAVQLDSRLDETSSVLRTIADTGVPTFYAGAAYDPPAARRDVAGQYLGRSLAQAARLIGHALPPW